MKGYTITSGYMGYVPWMGRYVLFSTERDYREFMND